MPAPKSTFLETAAGFLRQNNLPAAETACRNALTAAPDDPDALALLGDICMRSGRANRAAKQYRRAIDATKNREQPVKPPLLVALGGALQANGDARGALAVLNEALEADHDFVDARFARAGLAWGTGDKARAIADLKFVVDCQPDHVRAVSNLGAALHEAGDIVGAVTAMRPLVEAGEQDAMLLYNYGLALKDGEELDVAIVCLQRSLALQPDNLNAHIVLVSSLIMQSRLAEAEVTISSGLERWPDNTAMLSYRGSARLGSGDREGALEVLAHALEVDPECLPAHGYFAEAGGDMDNPARVDQIEAILARRQLQPHESALLHFAAGRRCMKLDRDEASFSHFDAGNAAKREAISLLGQGYNKATEERVVEELIRGFPRAIFDGHGGSDSQTPVFIVGMPRSGTSLVEQILASHPSVFGAGELNLINRAAIRLRHEAGYPLAPAPKAILKDISAAYLAYIKNLGAAADRITDKMPTNFRSLGLIAQLFPNARIIHVRRDPMDTCFSCYMQNFQGSGNTFIYSLDWLGHYYELYLRLMEHWRAVLPTPMLEVDYEALVADQEGESRRLVEFLDLEWDESCLDFHNAERAVVTASFTQVRQPIYHSSIGQWRRFGAQMKALSDKFDKIDYTVSPEIAVAKPAQRPGGPASMTENTVIVGENPSFSDLVHPVSEQDFFSGYYGKKLLHIEGGTRKFENVMSWDILSGILNQTVIWTSKSLQLVLDNNVVAEEAYCEPVTNRDEFEVLQPNAKKVMGLLRRGASLVTNDIDSLTPVVSGVAAAMEDRLAGKVQSNLYCSWQEHQAFGPHFDTHDVFAIHVAGEKLWNIYETRMDDPIAHPKFKSYGQDWHNSNCGAIAEQVLMRPGDLLYIPRGLYHDAMAQSDGTIHIAFGVTHVIGLDVVEMLKATVVDDLEFRRNMPRPEQGEAAVSAWLGALGSRLGAVLNSPEATRGMIEFQRDFRYPRGGITLPVLPAGRRFRLVTDGLTVEREDGKWLLSGKKGSVPIPPGLEAVVSWIVARPGFTEGQLAENFPDEDSGGFGKLLDDLAGMKVIAQN
ncbi:MAG: sulfotransferase [Proteobacteria bacterium]|nr:sulfotransferase [Pseudomonadota bacterium]